MINVKIIYKVLGSLLILEAILFSACLVLGVGYGERQPGVFGIPAALSLILGLLFKVLGNNGDNHMSRRDGYLCVSLAWLIFSAVGMLPFLLGGYETRIAVAFFESMSGFTTTGATALNNIDALPHSILFWRSLMHWFGGMGIVFFTIAILPTMGTGDLKLFSAEATGLKLGKLHPRISTTARWIWGVYLFLTAACGLAYYLGGMNVFDAVNHAFSTVATGGFSTHQSSFAYFSSPRLEAIAAVFMFLSGINFTLLYLLLVKGRFKSVFRDGEFRCYVFILVGATLVIAATLVASSGYDVLQALRLSFFNVSSLQSSTGLTSNDTMMWPHFTWIILILLTVCGSCAGSTSGGIKCIRIYTCYRLFVNEFRHILHPNAVLPLRLNQTTVTASVSHTVFAFFIAYVFLMLAGAILFLLMGFPLLDSFSISISSLSNTGPAFGHSVGPLDSWSAMPDAALWLSSFLMLAGRLEIFSLLLPFAPAFWRDN